MNNIITIMKFVVGCIAVSLATVKFKQHDKHTGFYWVAVSTYWVLLLVDSHLKYINW